MHDQYDQDNTKQASAATRHRLDGASARTANADNSKPMMEGPRNAIDGPRADSSRAREEMGRAEFGADVPMVENLSFVDALRLLMSGERVARRSWNGRGQWAALAHGGLAFGRSLGTQKPLCAFFVLSDVSGDLQMWVPSVTDILALDWCLVREKTILVMGSDHIGHRFSGPGATSAG